MKKIYTLILLLTVANIVTAQKLKTENIFIITLDGLRWQELFTGADSLLITNKQYVGDPLDLKRRFWEETPEARRKTLMPFFWSEIAGKGQLYGNRNLNSKVDCSNYMWFSYPGYSEILCGFADDDRINSNNKIDNPNVTVLEYLNRMPAYKGKVAAFCSWDVFPFIINRQRSGIPVNAGFEMASGASLTEREKFLNEFQSQIPSPWGGVRLDGFTHHYALEYIKKNKPKVVYIAYGETDDFAHDGKYDAYLKSAHQTDKFIENLWKYVQATPEYKDKTTFIITTDHGRGTEPIDTWRSHGTKIDGAGHIWFAVIGPDTPTLGEVKESKQYYQNQVAKTAAAFLGIEYTNEKPVGEVVKSMIKMK
ncbi:MAG: sulfatase-like hydrolase/transferase [Cyclobacteriaceae bacterium]|nr:sulfatase-like hydrolase/transferase [Cyclobacteriaceae bacterium]UYN87121.1 MAG: sulfatase-like hydrolase/transferase [Cyclobacteriaceae bacterium]